MRFGQQVNWTGNDGRKHQGTVVACGGQNPDIWGVTHNMNPQPNTPHETFIVKQGWSWIEYPQKQQQQGKQPVYNIPASQQMYADRMARENGRFQGGAIQHPTKTMSLGQLAYQRSFRNGGKLISQ